MASRSLNRVMLIGNLTRDPELKYTPQGTAVCTFGVATNRSWTTADGQTKEEVQYHRVVAWQKLAELCGKLLTKGRKVYLDGRLVYRTFVGRDGQQRTITEIVLEDFIVFGDGKRVTTAEEVETISNDEKINEAGAATDETTVPQDTMTQKKGSKEEKLDEKTKEKEDVNPDDIPF